MLGDIGDTRLIPGLGSSLAKGSGNPLQYSCLGNSMDRRVWQATVLGITKNLKPLSTHTVHNHSHHYLPPPHFMTFYPTVVQSQSHVWIFSTPWTEWSMPGSLIFCANPMSSELEMLSKHLILCHHILLLPSVFLMQASGSFPISQPFTSGGKYIGGSASVLPMNIRGWFPLGLTGLIFL